MTETALFMVGTIIFAITVCGVVLAGPALLERLDAEPGTSGSSAEVLHWPGAVVSSAFVSTSMPATALTVDQGSVLEPAPIPMGLRDTP